MNMRRITHSFFILLVTSGIAHADTAVFICKGDHGEKIFSQSPCGKNMGVKHIKTPEPPKIAAPRSAPLSIGMTEDEVTKLWGKPYDIHKSLYASAIHEQWVYKGCCEQRDYVYFENGKLTSIQLD